jgi:hypothetical protein
MPSTKPSGIGPEPGARGACAGDGVRRGDEGIGAVIDVEQRALRAFEQDAAARGASRRSRQTASMGELAGPERARSRASSASSARGRPAARRSRRASASWCAQQPVELRGSSVVQVGEVAHADRAAADLVLVGRADAAPGGADLARPPPPRAARRDRGGSAGSAGVLSAIAVVGRDGDALLRQEHHAFPISADERPGIEHDAVADHARACRRTTPEGSSESL